MTDIPQTDFMSLSEAAKSLPGQPSELTVRRWVLKGLRFGDDVVKLQVLRVGKRIKTCAKWLAAFQRTCDECRAKPKTRMVGDVRVVEHDAAERELEAMGA